MLHFYDRETIARALTLNLEPRLHHLLSMHIGALTDELIDHTEFLVVQPGDTEADIVRHIGFSPLIEPIEGTRWGAPEFAPGWDHLAYDVGWYAMTVTFGSTFAYVLLIQDVEGVPQELRSMCRTHCAAQPPA